MDIHKEMVICMKCGQINYVEVNQDNKLTKNHITCEECNNTAHISEYDYNPNKIKI